jgi:protein-S-isoprenylcysteine O-methyltransferase Ste14
VGRHWGADGMQGMSPRKLGALQSLGMAVLLGLLLFGVAQRWDVAGFWAFLLLWFASRLMAIVAADPDLIRERAKPGGRFRPETLLALAFPTAQLLLAALDVGHWRIGTSVPSWLQALGGLGFLLAGWLTASAIRANRFFSSVARVQEDRGHATVASGPYRFVRHPGYAAALLISASSGVLLGSWLSYLPALAWAGMVVWRLQREEALLAARLPGYASYASAVRWRVVPGVW